MCDGRPFSNEYLDIVKAIGGDRLQSGNNRGRINGWVGPNCIFGKCIRVEGKGWGRPTVQTIEFPVRMALYVALFTALLTILAAPVMKYFARTIPLLSCALIVFVTGFVVWYLFMAARLLPGLAGVAFPNQLNGALVFVGLFTNGWLINRYVARNYGIAAKFPSLGFKVMLGTLVGSWVLVGIYYGVSLALE